MPEHEAPYAGAGSATRRHYPMTKIGDRFERLTVIARSDPGLDGAARWLCRCTCGNESIARQKHLRSGHSQSCGCLIGEGMSVRRRGAETPAGTRIGRLVVVAQAPHSPKGWTRLECRCDCGSVVVVNRSDLRERKVASCGCWKREATAERNTTHGYTKGNVRTREYIAWKSAKARITNPKNKAYPDYGGRGITMAPEFLNDFPAFLTEVGPKPTSKHTIERIDNEKGYEPGNLKWATYTQQARNTRHTVLTLEAAREIRTLRGTMRQVDIAKQFGTCQSVVSAVLLGKLWKEEG